MIETVFALLLLMNNEIKEARIQDSLSMCLKHKREAERQQSDTVSYKCIKSKSELEKNIDGSITIKKLILE